MKKVKVNKNGYLASPYIADANITMEVNDELYEQLCSCELSKNWRYVNNEFIMVDILSDEVLRERRQRECFSIIDRSKLWYDRLTKEQLAELQAWYNAWLNVTETMQIPEKPSWLN